MDNRNFWTGLADFTTDEMSQNAIGIVARVVTFAEDFDEFLEKVRNIKSQMSGELFIIEEPLTVLDFLKQRLDRNHEIYEMLETAKANLNDVVYGEFHYYTQDDA